MIKIVVDAYGGDNSPLVNYEGTLKALQNLPEVEIVLVGNQEEIENFFADKQYDKSRLTILHAPDAITCHDKPTEAIKTKKESSLYKAFELMRNDPTARALVSIGSTGAVLAGAVLRVGRIKGVKRPAFCPILPTVQNGLVSICDSGANVDCDPIYLQQFAIMGSLYMQKAYGVENPRVALLNIGAEEEKGNQLAKDTYQLLKQTNNINFVGNMEGREVLDGNVDVVVCDGFDGNVLLKSTEGACLNMLKLVKRAFMANLVSKMGALLLKKEV
ncbi:MAG: phosphate acyltransferase PlsX, partial [Clostridia bacterium]|nr:phosphate acyltransferase PlsX [Clostridia bacterium]